MLERDVADLVTSPYLLSLKSLIGSSLKTPFQPLQNAPRYSEPTNRRGQVSGLNLRTYNFFPQNKGKTPSSPISKNR